MNKQIEEMTRDICDIECKGMKCDTCDGYCCEYRLQAEALYTAGYRKQSEGEWIEASDKPYSLCGKKCSLCGARISYREFNHGNHRFCHKCGAKMKGDKTDA